MNNCDVALHWAAKDWWIFPAQWFNDAHRPLVKWSTESSRDPRTVSEWFDRWPGAYPCVNLGKSNLCVVDVDDKHGKNGHDSLLALELSGMAFAATASNSTPSGKGRHYWFTGPLKNSAGILGVGIDTRGHGGMVPCPGVEVIQKGRYGMLPKRATFPAIPQWIVDRIGLPKSRANTPAPIAEADTEPHVLRAVAWLQDHAPRPLPGARNDTAFKVAAQLRDFGVSMAGGHALAARLWNPILEYPLSEDELRDVFSHAHEYASSQQGSQTAEAAGFKDLTEDQLKKSGLRLIDINEFLSVPAPKREWIIKDWLPLGPNAPTLVSGDGGAGKSTLFGIQLSLATAAGTPWLDEDIVKRMPAVYLSCEDDVGELHRRTEYVKNAEGLNWDSSRISGQVKFLPMVGHNSVLCLIRNGALVEGVFYQEIDSLLATLPWHGAPFLFVMDTVADIHTANENDRAAVNQLIKNKVCALCQRHNATPILIAHPPKSEATYSGSTAWNGAVRNRLFLAQYDPDNPGPRRVLTREKGNYAAAGQRKVLSYDRGVYRVIQEVEILDAIAERVLSAIRDAETVGMPLSRSPQAARYIVKAGITGADGKPLPKLMLQAAINRLIADGRIADKKFGRGTGLSAVEEE